MAVSGVAKVLFSEEGRRGGGRGGGAEGGTDAAADRFEKSWENEFSVERWKWAMSIVSSRSSFGPEEGLSIVLIADLFNHKPSTDRHRPKKFISDAGEFVLLSTIVYPKNSQVFIDYQMPNTELLVFYGFIDSPSSKYDSVGFSFSFDPLDPLLPSKLALLSSHDWQYSFPFSIFLFFSSFPFPPFPLFLLPLFPLSSFPSFLLFPLFSFLLSPLFLLPFPLSPSFLFY